MPLEAVSIRHVCVLGEFGGGAVAGDGALKGAAGGCLRTFAPRPKPCLTATTTPIGADLAERERADRAPLESPEELVLGVVRRGGRGAAAGPASGGRAWGPSTAAPRR